MATQEQPLFSTITEMEAVPWWAEMVFKKHCLLCLLSTATMARTRPTFSSGLLVLIRRHQWAQLQPSGGSCSDYQLQIIQGLMTVGLQRSSKDTKRSQCRGWGDGICHATVRVRVQVPRNVCRCRVSKHVHTDMCKHAHIDTNIMSTWTHINTPNTWTHRNATNTWTHTMEKGDKSVHTD